MKKISGYVAPVITEQHYVLGASPLAQKVLVPDGQWLQYLGEFEPQNKGWESYNCTSFNTLGCLEAIETRLDTLKENYSDRFTGIMAGTRPPGNDPLTVANSLRHSGVIPETLLPFSDDLQNAEEYYSFKNSDEKTCTLKGKEWTESWDFGYEIVPTNPDAMKKALQFSPLGVSVYAWQKRGELFRADDIQIQNHWTKVVGYKDGEYWIADDSYMEDGTPFKHLEWSFPFGLAVRYHLELRPETKKKLNWLESLLNLLKQQLNLLFPQPVKSVTMLEEPMPSKYKWDTKADRIHSTRLICDEEGLPYDMKNRLCATIECESGWDPRATNMNTDGTKDIGICQYNTRWYISKDRPIPSIEAAYEDLELCIRTMVRAFKKGRARDWVCYQKLYNVK